MGKCWRQWYAAERLACGCRGCLAAVSDSLGRVQIIDTAAAAVVRMLKGYRDAKCAWVVLPATPPAARGHAQQPEQQDTSADDGHQTRSLSLTEAQLRPGVPSAAEGHTAQFGAVEASGRERRDPSLTAELSGLDLAKRAEDAGSQASSQDSFASARDASFAAMDTDQGGDAGEQHESAPTRRDFTEGFAEPFCRRGSRAQQAGTESMADARAQGREAGHGEAAGHTLLLAVHAPRRGVVDVWVTVHGPRLCSIRAGPHCCMLTAPPLLGLGDVRGAAGGAPQSACYLLGLRERPAAGPDASCCGSPGDLQTVIWPELYLTSYTWAESCAASQPGCTAQCMLTLSGLCGVEEA